MEQLARDGVMEEDYMTESREGRRPKIFTFFQLALKPGLDTKSRDCREISLLARCLDMLREGRLANLADTLAARLLARQVEKAGGKGSWPKSGQWNWGEWQADSRPKGKAKGDKGKGKRGKGKNKAKGKGDAAAETENKAKGGEA